MKLECRGWRFAPWWHHCYVYMFTFLVFGNYCLVVCYTVSSVTLHHMVFSEGCRSHPWGHQQGLQRGFLTVSPRPLVPDKTVQTNVCCNLRHTLRRTFWATMSSKPNVCTSSHVQLLEPTHTVGYAIIQGPLCFHGRPKQWRSQFEDLYVPPHWIDGSKPILRLEIA